MRISNVNVLISLGDLMILGETGGVPLRECTILESLEHPIPMCTISFDANEGFLKDYPITDGTQLGIQIFTEDRTIDEKYTFRVYNTELDIMGHYINYKLTCILDVYDLFLSGDKFAKKTTSAEIFKSVANSLKIPFNIDATFDKQLWVPSNWDLMHWLTNISNYGYVDELSCMLWGIEKNKTLLYKNLSTIIKQHPKEGLLKLIPSNDNKTKDKKALTYNSAEPSFASGIENLTYRGYGGYDTYFDFPSYSSKKFSANKVVASSNMININKELSKGLNPTQHAIDIGNFHEHYYTAYMQNLRQLSTYSTYMTVLMETWSPYLRLLNPVVLEYAVSGMLPSAAENQQVDSLSSVYIINKITTTITAGTLSQGLQLMGQGYNTTKSTETY